jgi:transposase-like protein
VKLWHFADRRIGARKFAMRLKKKATVARRIRRMHSPEFKARIALEALSGHKTQAQLCQEYDLHANQINDWKQQLIAGAKGVFGAPAVKEVDTTAMEAKIGRLTLENDFLERALTKAGLLSARK